MSIALRRITTRYLELEDRLQLSGELPDGPPVVIWMTQRLLLRVLPPLLQWVEAQSGGAYQETAGRELAQAVHSFEQQAARAALAPQAPVCAHADSAAWVAHTVEIQHSAQGVQLTFLGPQDQKAQLTMAAEPLRQWLNIVFDQWRKSDWPMTPWPAWMHEDTGPVTQSRSLLH